MVGGKDLYSTRWRNDDDYKLSNLYSSENGKSDGG